MKVIPKLQQGNTIESDNTKVVRPEIHEPIKAKPRQYSIVDLGGEPSNDTRSAAERNRDYWHPIKGAKARFRASMSNETNPLVGIERTILPSAAGAALVTTPAAVVGGALGNMTVDKLTGGWGNWLEDKTGIPSEIGVYTNPGAWYGGAKGYKIGKDKLITKSIKGDADLAWNPINKNHWIFNKEARTPSNIAMATANRITPFLSKVEKLPLKVAAYKAAKRTNGNASVSLQDIKTMPADYTGSSILGGGNLEGRNLLAKYIFDENPVVKRMFFNKATSNIKPISRNEARRGFSHGDRYEQLYPGIYNRRYEMSAVVPSGRPLKFQEASEFTEYAGKNPIGKIIGKEAEPVMRMGDKEFMTFRQPGTDYIGPIDDVAGHLVKFQMNKGKLRQTSQDMWKFNPADYAKRWNNSPNTANQVRLIKQAALMDKVGRPFILQQSNPIWIEGKSVRNPELVTMAHGGRFDFKKSPLLKKQEEINGKRDMRKKFIKSSRPTYKKRIKKAQQGMRFVSYNPVSNPTIDYTDITNPINPFSEYNYNTTYDKPEALVVPVRDTNEPDVVANNPTVEPVINKPVASKPVTDKPVTANSTWKSPYTNRRQWSTELINAYKKAGITNDNAIRMLLAQDALESSWGKSAQGKYNFGNLTTGSSWKGDYVTGNDKNAKGEAIKQKFRSYNSMDEYAADKIQFLKRLYDFDENDDINKFVAKLTGSNKGKRRYAEATNYAKVLTGVYNGIPKGENGMIIKYQEPAQPIKYMGGYDKRGNMVLPVTNENGMNNVTLPEVTVTPRNINLAGAVDRGRRTVGNMGKEILSATTPLGDIESAKDIYQDARSGNYGQAALGAGLLLLPNFIEKPLKTLKRVGKDYVIITKDFVSSPKRFRQARKDGTYPLTYKERRRYLEEAHKVGDKAAARVDAANIGDYQYRVNNYPNTYHAVNLVDGVNTRYTFNSKSYKNFDDANHSSGVNSSSWNINSHINIKKSPNSKYLIPTGGADGVGANVAHELQHSYQKVLPDITLMTSTRNGQRLVNEEHITANALAPLKGKAGTWEGNPRELNSEVMSIRTGLNAPRYNLMTPEQQGIMKYYIGRKFDLDDNVVHNMLNELGKLGYKNGGKL